MARREWNMVPQTWTLRHPIQDLTFAMVHEHEVGGWVAFVWVDPRDDADNLELTPQPSREAAMDCAEACLRDHGVVF